MVRCPKPGPSARPNDRDTGNRNPEVGKMPSTIRRVIAVAAMTVAVGAIAAPPAMAKERPLGNGSLAFCFVVPFPGSAELEWCL